MLRRFSLAVFLALAVAAWAEEPAVQLMLPSRTLELRSTFEVRFAADMVAAEQIGRQADASPLVFDPPIEGRFVWLSTRSGTFAPTQPLPLGTKFKISLRPGLKDGAGNSLKAKLIETAETPPMRVKGAHSLGSTDFANASIVPRFLVLFNANVKAAAAAKFCRFEDASGNRIAARVEQANDPSRSERTFPSWESDDQTLSAWSASARPRRENRSGGFGVRGNRGRKCRKENGTGARKHSVRRTGQTAAERQRLAPRPGRGNSRDGMESHAPAAEGDKDRHGQTLRRPGSGGGRKQGRRPAGAAPILQSALARDHSGDHRPLDQGGAGTEESQSGGGRPGRHAAR